MLAPTYRQLIIHSTTDAPTCLSSITSFMLLLFVTAHALADAKDCLEMLIEWRSLLRVKDQSPDFTRPSLQRLEDIFEAGVDRTMELSPAAQQAWDEDRQKHLLERGVHWNR